MKVTIHLKDNPCISQVEHVYEIIRKDLSERFIDEQFHMAGTYVNLNNLTVYIYVECSGYTVLCAVQDAVQAMNDRGDYITEITIS